MQLFVLAVVAYPITLFESVYAQDISSPRNDNREYARGVSSLRGGEQRNGDARVHTRDVNEPNVDIKGDGDDEEDLLAVIHIGSNFAGSSAIQAALGTVYKELLSVDSYEEASFAMREEEISTTFFIGCFRPDAIPFSVANQTAGGGGFVLSCHPHALDLIRQVATERKHHLIITAEYLTDPRTDIQMLSDFVKQYWKKQKIVAYYRRFYDWLLSAYYDFVMTQFDRNHHIDNDIDGEEQERPTFPQYLADELKSGAAFSNMYITDAVQRYRPYFDNIEIINIYDHPPQQQQSQEQQEVPDQQRNTKPANQHYDVRRSFFCQGITNAYAACDKINERLDFQASIANSTDPKLRQQLNRFLTDYNIEISPTTPFIYDDLMYYSYEMGLWNTNYLTSSSTIQNMDDVEGDDNDIEAVEETFNAMERVTKLIQDKLERSLAKVWYQYSLDEVHSVKVKDTNTYYHDSTLVSKQAPRTCPKQEDLDLLLKISLVIEEKLFPDYYKKQGRDEILEHFQQMVTEKRFCSIDANLLLRQQKHHWKQLFQSIQQQLHEQYLQWKHNYYNYDDVEETDSNEISTNNIQTQKERSIATWHLQ